MKNYIVYNFTECKICAARADGVELCKSCSANKNTIELLIDEYNSARDTLVAVDKEGEFHKEYKRASYGQL